VILIRLLASALIVLGIGTMVVSVLGTLRGERLLFRVQSASELVVLGNVSLMAAAIGTGDPSVVARAALVALFLLVTSSASAHAIALSQHRGRREGDER
jgi:multisubunit Na+/H+ antiporter MnhG subunit